MEGLQAVASKTSQAVSAIPTSTGEDWIEYTTLNHNLIDVILIKMLCFCVRFHVKLRVNIPTTSCCIVAVPCIFADKTGTLSPRTSSATQRM